jgi:hypothetical protein
MWGYYSLLNRDKEDFHQWRFFDARKRSGADVTILVCLIPHWLTTRRLHPTWTLKKSIMKGLEKTNLFQPSNCLTVKNQHENLT